ncbi:MAG: helix-turn-helix domain-containing protein [Phycisphaerae bacterium]|nr:helix-turn-helix domain-containing protein [Phycisphaerae bacterium]
MPNIAQVLKDEIQRLAKKEIKTPTSQLRKGLVALKRSVADLKKRISELERENRRLTATTRKRQQQQPAAPSDETASVWFTSKGIRSQRGKLGLSQADFAKLVGVSSLTVYQWERKEGKLTLRGPTKAALAGIRGIGVREARQRLEEQDEGEKKTAKKKAKSKGRKKVVGKKVKKKAAGAKGRKRR